MIDMSEVIKLTYRGFGGFIALMLIFTFAVASFAFFISGVAVIALAVYILIDPSILQSINVMFFTQRITDATFGSAISFVLGIFIILLGALFLALTSLIWKYSVKLNAGLTSYVDSNVPKTSTLVHRARNPSSEPTDKISKLERLAKLKEQGILTEQEFLQEKQLILKEKY